MKHVYATDLAMIARNGGGVTASARRFVSTELAMVARSLTGSAVLHVTHAEALTSSDMAMIARNARSPAYVMFSTTD